MPPRAICRAGRAEHCGDYLLFWLKEDLYLACAEWIADFIGTQFHPHVEEATALLGQPSPDRAAVRQLILNACHDMIRLLTHDDTLNLSKFISRSSSPRPPPTSGYTIG
jgi:AcrR family transcriptional regulator